MFVTWRAPVLVALGAVAVLLRPQTSTAVAWAGLAAVIVLADWWLAPRANLLRITRSKPGHTRPGVPAPTELTVTSDRKVRGWLRDAWQPSAGARGDRHPLDVAPGVKREFTTLLVPQRRGDLSAQATTVRSLGPLGLAGRQVSLSIPGRIRVWPAFPSARVLPSRLARLRELDGRTAVRTRGQGTEFDSLREYVRGDDVRSIDWRATARSPRAVVRTWRPERDRRVVLVLDSGRTSAGRIGDIPRLDAQMDAAMLLAALAQRAGDRVDVVAGDRAVRLVLRGGHDRDGFNQLQDALAPIHPRLVETQWARLIAAVERLGRQRGLVVLLTPVEPSAILDGLLPLLGPLVRRHRIVIASVRDAQINELARTRDSVTEVYAAAAAERTLQQRLDTVRMLAALGVTVLDADADTLPAQLADHYLALKARGLL